MAIRKCNVREEKEREGKSDSKKIEKLKKTKGKSPKTNHRKRFLPADVAILGFVSKVYNHQHTGKCAICLYAHYHHHHHFHMAEGVK